MESLIIRIEKNKETGQFHWTLKAENKKTIAWSGESYKTKAKCLHGLALVVNGVRTAAVVDETGDAAEPMGRASRVFPARHDGM